MSTNKTCLVAGGLGYIGSHICVELLSENYDLVIIDNLSNSNIDKLDKIKKISNSKSQIYFYQIDLVYYDDLVKSVRDYFSKTNSKPIDIIIHLAGFKAVGESVKEPLKYYHNNLSSTLNLIHLMENFNIPNIIFSSSSTIYGSEPTPPYTEQMQTGLGITNPYGRSKFIQEEILKDIQLAHKDWNIVLLRYFNPIGHLVDDLKEEPNGIPNNLFPYLVKVYNKQLEKLVVFGNDYNTRDGTCTRDFVSVVDLANAHKTCCNYVLNNKQSENSGKIKIYNVGTGHDTSVLELISAFEKMNNCVIPFEFGPRREGDLESSYSNVDLIYKELGWKASYGINDCVKI